MPQTDKWREKYLDALDEQERLEKLAVSQAEMLRRVVVNLSAAAAGLDEELDRALEVLKEKLRGATGSVVTDHVAILEKVVQQFEEKRQGQLAGLGIDLKSLLAELHTLSVPPDLEKTISDYSRKLNQPITKVLSIADHIQAIADIQARSLKAAQKPPVSFMQRMRGGVQLNKAFQGKPEDLCDGGKDDSIHGLDDESWQNVDSEIKTVLRSILESLPEKDRESEAWTNARRRVDQPMDWQQLLHTLEDLKRLLHGRDSGLDQAISSYLAQVNQELQDICQQLGLEVIHQQEREEAAHLLGQAVTNQVAHIQSSLDSAETLEGLKKDIRDQISLIQNAVDHYRSQQERRKPLSEELQRLIEKVKSIEEESARTQVLLAEERHRAHHDALTELPNREAYNQRVAQEWQRFRRYGRTLCMAVVDIDHFKQLNDQYGHKVGDRVLRLVAQSLAKRLRTVDFVARYGGEEFVVLLPETNLDDAYQVMESARKAFSEGTFRFKSEPVRITFSCGVSVFREGDTVDSVFERVDAAMYQAKNQGRNRTCKVDE